MELTINNTPCDLPITPLKVPGFDTSTWADPEAARNGRRLTLTLPITPRNDLLFGFERDPERATRFNTAHHPATLTADGAILMEGAIRLLAASDAGYTVELREAGAGWARQASLRMFNSLGVAYNESLTPTTIHRSWTEETPVRFFPIHRDQYPQQNSSLDLQPNLRMLSVDDYHPFLHIATLVEQIFAESGYTLRSRFFESAFFRSLYMSGAYSSSDTTAAMARMGFLARRLTTVSSTANWMGRVYANPFTTVATVGNLVESASPQSIDEEGNTVPDLYNNGGCFTLDSKGAICFTPTTEVSVGFEYYLKYTTEHRILSRQRLTGFDSLYLGPGSEMRFQLANRYTDRRDNLSAGYQYRVIVFDHLDGARYRLRYTLNGVSGALWSEFASRSALVTTPSTGAPSAPTLEIQSDGNWVPYTGDWALYDGYIEEEGETTVEVRVCTASERLSPASPKHFDTIYFFGANEGQRLTLHKECSIRPRFLASPGYGSTLTFQDVAHHRIRQIELLKALSHLFNLRFHTEEQTRTVWVDPYDDFYGDEWEFDWRDKVDLSEPTELTDLTPALHEVRTWCYQEGDGAVRRFESEAKTTLGSWSRSTDSDAALEGEAVLRSPLFTPSVLSQGHYDNAPSAWMLQLGDRDALEEEGEPFAPRIVIYRGEHPLAAGEQWGWPSNEGLYPLAAFHFAGDETMEGWTLCFENRDGQQGLHRFYDRNLRHEEQGGQVTLTLRLKPHEWESLQHPESEAPSLHSTFRLMTSLGECWGTIHRIEAYDPAQGSVRCTFNRHDR